MDFIFGGSATEKLNDRDPGRNDADASGDIKTREFSPENMSKDINFV